MHHIDEWAVYQTHDATHMIAICPTCHDAVHSGTLRITDNYLYLWKQAARPRRTTDVLYVEPGTEEPILRMGPLQVRGRDGIVVFAPTMDTQLSFRIEGRDLGLVNCTVSDINGDQLIEIVDNRVRFDDRHGAFVFDRRPGHFRFTGPAEAMLSDWMISGARTRIPTFGDGPVTILEAEVVAPGEVTVRGIWVDGERSLIVDRIGWIVPRSAEGAMLIEGEGAVINWLGPVGTSMFEHGFMGIF